MGYMASIVSILEKTETVVYLHNTVLLLDDVCQKIICGRCHTSDIG